MSGPSSPAILKSPSEVEALRRAATVAEACLARGLDACRDGRTTAGAADAVHDAIRAHRGEAVFRGLRADAGPAYPSAACVCVNDQVVHAIPSSTVLRAGDLVTVDVGVRLDGWCADAARSAVVPGEDGEPVGSPDAGALIAGLRAVMSEAVRSIRPGAAWSAVAGRLEAATAAAGCGYVAQYVGHGVGRSLHEPPRAPAYWTGFDGPDFEVRPGMVLAIEPILTRPRPRGGRTPVRLLTDGWTVVTADGSLAAHEERMLAVDGGGASWLATPAGEADDG